MTTAPQEIEMNEHDYETPEVEDAGAEDRPAVTTTAAGGSQNDNTND